MAYGPLIRCQDHDEDPFVFDTEPFVAMFTYTSSEAGDLTFNQGETILVTKKEGDWWTGSLGERSGIFPANYVKATEQQQVSGDEYALLLEQCVTCTNRKNVLACLIFKITIYARFICS